MSRTIDMKKLALIAWMALMMLAVSSCASRKKTVAPPQPQAFEWLTTNFDVQAEGDRLPIDELSGQLRIRRDSILWLSISATMGVEAVRAKVSNDSVWVINRLDKTYLAEPLDTFSALIGMPLSLSVIQSLLLDNNEGLPPVEHQTVLLQSHLMGGVSAKIRYDNVRVDKETGFPLKITDKMKRIGLNKRN